MKPNKLMIVKIVTLLRRLLRQYTLLPVNASAATSRRALAMPAWLRDRPIFCARARIPVFGFGMQSNDRITSCLFF